MEIEIDSKKKNPLLDREDIYFIINHEDEGTPERDLVRQKLAEKLNSKKDSVIIDHIKADSGFQRSRGYAKAYSSPDKARAIERNYILQRNPIGGAPSKKKETKETEEQKEKPAETEKKKEAEETEKKEETKEKPGKSEEKEEAEEPEKKQEKKEDAEKKAAEQEKESSSDQKKSEKKEDKKKEE